MEERVIVIYRHTSYFLELFFRINLKTKSAVFITCLVITRIWILHSNVVAPKNILPRNLTKELQENDHFMSFLCKIVPLLPGSLIRWSIAMDPKYSIMKGLECINSSYFTLT